MKRLTASERAKKFTEGVFNFQESVFAQNKVTQMEQEDLLKESVSNIHVPRSRRRSLLLREKASFTKDLRDTLFTNFLTECVTQSLMLDEDFKERHSDAIKTLVETTTKGLLAEEGFEETLSESSYEVQKMYKLAESIADEKAKEKFTEDKIDKTDELSEEDKELSKKDLKKKQLDEAAEESEYESIAKIEASEISSIVREKVVQTITNEKMEADKNKADLEAVQVDPDPVGSAAADAGMSEEEDNLEEEADASDDTLSESTKQYLKAKAERKGYTQPSLFSTLHESVLSRSIKEKQAILSENANAVIEINKDLVFAEAVTRYTLMETLHTAKIVRMDGLELREYVRDLTR